MAHNIVRQGENMKNFFIVVFVLVVGVGIGWLWNRYENRSCVLAENEIMQKYDFSIKNAVDLDKHLTTFRMYRELAEKGCPEHSDGYRKKASGEMALAEKIITERTLDGGGIYVGKDGTVVGTVNGGVVLRADMNKVAETVNQAVEAAAGIFGDMVDKMKDTKVNITIE
jgi:hypothetical protein